LFPSLLENRREARVFLTTRSFLCVLRSVSLLSLERTMQKKEDRGGLAPGREREREKERERSERWEDGDEKRDNPLSRRRES
jgi:hypothetical protein